MHVEIVEYMLNCPKVSFLGKKIPEMTPNNELFKNTSAVAIILYKYKCVI